MKPADPQRELFVLGLLRRAPLSAYAVDRALREHVPLYRRFGRGNTYAFVDRLATAGLLARRRAATRRGPREEQWIYRLSATGERRFHELLRAVVADVQASDAAFETALVLLGQLPRDEALELMVERAREVERHERRISRLYGEERGRSGAAAFSRARAVHRVRSERRFLEESIALLRDPKWEPGWIADDGPVVDPARKL